MAQSSRCSEDESNQSNVTTQPSCSRAFRYLTFATLSVLIDSLNGNEYLLSP
jgi:hypothetical protein